MEEKLKELNNWELVAIRFALDTAIKYWDTKDKKDLCLVNDAIKDMKSALKKLGGWGD